MLCGIEEYTLALAETEIKRRERFNHDKYTYIQKQKKHHNPAAIVTTFFDLLLDNIGEHCRLALLVVLTETLVIYPSDSIRYT